MAVSIGKVYDPAYYTRIAAGAENYYLVAVAEHGEPPGIWTGRLGPEVGLEIGSEVDPRVFEELAGHFVDPRDPNAGNRDVDVAEKAKLGRPPRHYKSALDLYKAALEVEPEATPERKKQLWMESKKAGRQALKGLDLTFSPPKSVTLLHAAFELRAKQCREAGREDEAQVWDARAAAVWDSVMAGNQAMLDVFQDQAGASRAGYHGKKIAGRTTGRYVRADRWIIASFRQHTSRGGPDSPPSGDPHLHVHNVVPNRVLTEEGEWRTLDSNAIHRTRAQACAVGERTMAEHLAKNLGVEVRMREDGHGFEVVGVDQGTIKLFSSRTTQISERLAEVVAAFKERHGRAPTQHELFSMAQFVTLDTRARKPKGDHVPSRGELLQAWEEQATRAAVETLQTIPEQTLGRLTPEQLAEHAAETYDIDEIIETALADVESRFAVWDRSQLVAALNRYLPDVLGGLEGEDVRRVLDQLADQATSGRYMVYQLTAPPVVAAPQQLLREDGSSVYEPLHGERYTTDVQLAHEGSLLRAARADGAARVPAERAAELLGLTIISDDGVSGYDPEFEESRQGPPEGEEAAGTDREADGSATEHEPLDPEAVPTEDASLAETAAETMVETVVVPTGDAPARGLRADQATAVYGILTSGRKVDVLVGPAGSGKSYAMGHLATLWTEETRGSVIGLATSQAAALVLADEGLDAFNIRKFLIEHEAGRIRLTARDLLIVDEASMVTTGDLAAVQEIAARANAKILLTGDPAQLDAPGAGGMMRQIVDEVGAYQLTDVTRMREKWEREASLLLRQGDMNAVLEYDKHGRFHEGTGEEMAAEAYQAWLADYLEGRDSLLVVGTVAQAAELSARARAELVAAAKVDPDGIELRDGNLAGVGDLIQARLNSRRIEAGEPDRNLANRDVLQVMERLQLGGKDVGLRVRRLIGTNRAGVKEWSDPFDLPLAYVAGNVELAYAVTAHAAQGRTVWSSHAVVDEQTYRELLYVMLTRGRAMNVAYITTDEMKLSDINPTPAPAAAAADPATRATGAERDGKKIERDRFDVLAAILDNAGARSTALQTLREELDRATHLGHLGPMWVDLTREHTQRRIDTILRQVLAPDDYDRYVTEDDKSPLVRLFLAAEWAGHDAEALLRQVVPARSFSDVDSVGKVIYWRIEGIVGDAVPLVDVESGQGVTWAGRVPTVADLEIEMHLRDLADAKDDRLRVLGEQLAENPPAWASEYLGPVPADPLRRAGWERRAGIIQGYREEFLPESWSEAEPIGSEPSRDAPEARAAYHAAFQAMGSPEDQRPMSTRRMGELWLLRARYARQAGWAPADVAEEMRKAATAHQKYQASAVRIRAHAAAAPADKRTALLESAERQERLAEQARTRYRVLAEIDAARAGWLRATEDARREALQADAEIRERLRRSGGDPELLPTLHGTRTTAEDDAAEHQARARREHDERQLEFDLGLPPVAVEADQRSAEQEPAAAGQETGHEQLEFDLGLAARVGEGAEDLQTDLERARAQARVLAEQAEEEELRVQEAQSIPGWASRMFGAWTEGELQRGAERAAEQAAEQLTAANEKLRAALDQLETVRSGRGPKLNRIDALYAQLRDAEARKAAAEQAERAARTRARDLAVQIHALDAQAKENPIKLRLRGTSRAEIEQQIERLTDERAAANMEARRANIDGQERDRRTFNIGELGERRRMREDWPAYREEIRRRERESADKSVEFAQRHVGRAVEYGHEQHAKAEGMNRELDDRQILPRSRSRTEDQERVAWRQQRAEQRRLEQEARRAEQRAQQYDPYRYGPPRPNGPGRNGPEYGL